MEQQESYCPQCGFRTEQILLTCPRCCEHLQRKHCQKCGRCPSYNKPQAAERHEKE